MNDTISSRTPEGSPNICQVCGAKVRIEPSSVPRRDAPCPNCGTLLVFEESDAFVFSIKKHTHQDLIRLAKITINPQSRKQIYFDLEGADDSGIPFIEKIIITENILQSNNRTVKFINANKEFEEFYKTAKLYKSSL